MPLRVWNVAPFIITNMQITQHLKPTETLFKCYQGASHQKLPGYPYIYIHTYTVQCEKGCPSHPSGSNALPTYITRLRLLKFTSDEFISLQLNDPNICVRPLTCALWVLLYKARCGNLLYPSCYIQWKWLGACSLFVRRWYSRVTQHLVLLGTCSQQQVNDIVHTN